MGVFAMLTRRLPVPVPWPGLCLCALPTWRETGKRSGGDRRGSETQAKGSQCTGGGAGWSLAKWAPFFNQVGRRQA